MDFNKLSQNYMKHKRQNRVQSLNETMIEGPNWELQDFYLESDEPEEKSFASAGGSLQVLELSSRTQPRKKVKPIPKVQLKMSTNNAHD